MRNGIVISESLSPRPPEAGQRYRGIQKDEGWGEGVRGKRKGKEEYEAEGRRGVERWW